MIYIIKEFNKKYDNVKIIKTNSKKVFYNIINNMLFNQYYYFYNFKNNNLNIDINNNITLLIKTKDLNLLNKVYKLNYFKGDAI